MSVIEACTHYGIGGKMSVYRWIKKYEQSEGISASSNPTTMALENESTSPREQASELASVKRLLELERLRSEALMKMIKLAEEKYGIAIEKKSGPKRSKR
jgi:transposase-like protein